MIKAMRRGELVDVPAPDSRNTAAKVRGIRPTIDKSKRSGSLDVSSQPSSETASALTTAAANATVPASTSPPLISERDERE